MFRFKFCIVSLAFCFFAAVGLARNNQSSRNGPLVTFAEKLGQHHISLTRDALIDALHDNDPGVRWLAAAQLAQDGPVDTIPFIRKALEKEGIPHTKINIASTLAGLGDQDGIEALKKGCSSAKNSLSIKMLATEYLLNLGSTYCLGAEFEGLQSKSDSDCRIQALSFVSKFQGISQDITKRLVGLSVEALKDQTAGVRIYAGQALAKLGDLAAAPYLRGAIAPESDEGVRSQLEDDLKSLQKKRQY
jgi:HEAT repeat protein